MPDGGGVTVAPITVVTSDEVWSDGTTPLCTKQMRRDDSGEIVEFKPYGKATYFKAETFPVASLEDLEQIGRRLGATQAFVGGRPKAGVDTGHMVRRLETLEDYPRPWFDLDIENIPACDDDGEFVPTASVERTLDLVTSKLPEWMQGADVLWQWSSSAGITSLEEEHGDSQVRKRRFAEDTAGNEIHVHLKIWSDRALTLKEQKELLHPYLIRKVKEERVGFIDGSLFSPEHFSFTAPPVFFDGRPDPLPVRFGIRAGSRTAARVPLEAPAPAGGQPVAAKPAPAGGQPGGSRQYDDADRELARRLLLGIDPNLPREEWTPVIAALYHVYGGSQAGEDIASAWMRGLLYRGPYAAPEAAQYRDDGEVRRVYNSYKERSEDYPLAGLSTLQARARGADWEPRTPAETYGPPSQYGEILPAEPHPLAPAPRATRQIIDLHPLGRLFEEPDPEELIEGMIMEGEHFAILGEPKAGKSFLAIELGMAIAAGGESVVGHHRVKKRGPVVYLSGEGHSGFKRRLMAWAQHHGIALDDTLDVAEGVKRLRDVPFFYNKGVIPATASAEDLERIVADIRDAIGCDPALVFLDTVSRSLGGDLDENGAQAAMQYMNTVELARGRLRTTWGSVIHASNKGKPGGKIDIRGSSAFSAAFDAVWAVRLNREKRTVEMSAVWLKEADELGPFYFRMVPVQIKGLPPTKRNSSIVLEYVDPGVGHTTMRETTEGSNLGIVVEGLLRQWGVNDVRFLWDDGRVADLVCAYYRGEKPADDIDAETMWQTERNKIKKALQTARNTKRAWALRLTEARAGADGKVNNSYWRLPPEEAPAEQKYGPPVAAAF